MMEIDELRTKFCKQYSSDAEAADAIATANAAVADATGEPYVTPGHPDSIGE